MTQLYNCEKCGKLLTGTTEIVKHKQDHNKKHQQLRKEIAEALDPFDVGGDPDYLPWDMADAVLNVLKDRGII